jgi:hypothetical protein
MTIKSNDIVFRAICIVAIAVSTFYYPVNNGFFGFLIIVFGLLFLFGGTESIELTNREVIFKFERLVQLWTRQKIIRIDKIKEVEYIPGKVSGAAIFLNLIEYVSGNVKPKDEIVIEFLDGDIYRHHVVGTKKEFKEFFGRLKEKINTTR